MRHILSYLVFVGTPLLGLLGVLRVGQGLQAPHAVHGFWAVQPGAASGRVCTRYLLAGGDSTIVLSQSGRRLSGRLGPHGEVAVLGDLAGTDLALEGVIQPGSTPRHVGCVEGDTLRLIGRVETNGRLRHLEARLSSTGCPECGEFGFTAERPHHYQGRRRA